MGGASPKETSPKVDAPSPCAISLCLSLFVCVCARARARRSAVESELLIQYAWIPQRGRMFNYHDKEVIPSCRNMQIFISYAFLLVRFIYPCIFIVHSVRGCVCTYGNLFLFRGTLPNNHFPLLLPRSLVVDGVILAAVRLVLP